MIVPLTDVVLALVAALLVTGAACAPVLLFLLAVARVTYSSRRNGAEVLEKEGTTPS